MSEKIFTPEEFKNLPRPHLEQYKFTLTADWKVAVRVIWGSAWDMLKSVYDPANWEKQVAFAADLWTMAAENVWSYYNNTAVDNLLLNYQLTSEKGSANWYAPLWADSKINPIYMPDLAISSYLWNFTDIDNALDDAWVQASQEWDWLTTDEEWGSSYIVTNTPPTVAWDFVKMKTPTDAVSSVNWRTGVVTWLANLVWGNVFSWTQQIWWQWNPILRIIWDWYSDAEQWSIEFASWWDSEDVRTRIVNDESDNWLRFDVRPTDAESWIKSFFIDRIKGNVWIGTSSPTTPLDIKWDDWSSYERILKLSNSNWNNKLTIFWDLLNDDSNHTAIQWESNWLWLFAWDYNNNKNQLFLATTGNVWIWTTDPLADLHIQWAWSNDVDLRIWNNWWGTIWIYDWDEDVMWQFNSWTTGGHFYLLRNTTGADDPVMHVHPNKDVTFENGNVWIWTWTSWPLTKLHIKWTGWEWMITIEWQDSWLALRDVSDNTLKWSFGRDNTDNSIQIAEWAWLWTNVRFIVKEWGNVWVWTTSPIQKFDVRQAPWTTADMFNDAHIWLRVSANPENGAWMTSIFMSSSQSNAYWISMSCIRHWSWSENAFLIRTHWWDVEWTDLFRVNYDWSIKMYNLPTSSSWLSSWNIWNDWGTLKIV